MDSTLPEKLENILVHESSTHVRIEKINELLVGSSIDDQHMLGSFLSFEALEEIYRVRGDLLLSNSVEEHLLFSYFLKASKTSVTNELIQNVIEEYKRNMYVSLESVIVEWIKNEKLSPEQIEVAKQNFNDKEVVKQLRKLSAKHDLRNGKRLSSKNISELIDSRVFDVLESALDLNMVELEALEKFTPPISGENDKKHKRMLYEKAQVVLNFFKQKNPSLIRQNNPKRETNYRIR